MKQTLQIRIGQQLTMTPQLQQAIRLLQLSALDLREEIQEALESNPMLELAEDGQDEHDGSADGGEAPRPTETGDETTAVAGDADPRAERAADDPGSGELGEVSSSLEQVADELPVDSAWEDTYETGPRAAPTDADGRDLEGQDAAAQTLHDHLMWQMHMTTLSDRDRAIALAIIDGIDDRGYLTETLEDIQAALAEGASRPALGELEAVLRQVQSFDPLGVGARDLRECILLQLAAMPPETPWLAEAQELVREHLTLFAEREYNQIMRRMKCSQEDLQRVLGLIQSVNPHPGRQIADARVEYVIPDVVVRRDGQAWRVELNPEALPRLRINSSYASLVRRADNSRDNTYLRNHLQEARWFVKSLQSRNETLLKVATCIVERQRGFLEHGEEAMRPLVLNDIATAIEMHESTISRVTTQKYMHTPRGVFELKYFFSSHVSTDGGGEASATAIRALIRRMIAEEDPTRPLSDNRIATMLKAQGINVARRTIAKYRETLSIPSSSERRRLL